MFVYVVVSSVRLVFCLVSVVFMLFIVYLLSRMVSVGIRFCMIVMLSISSISLGVL